MDRLPIEAELTSLLLNCKTLNANDLKTRLETLAATIKQEEEQTAVADKDESTTSISKVFETTELAELIYTHLPLLSILLLTLVDRTARATILSSLKIARNFRVFSRKVSSPALVKAPFKTPLNFARLGSLSQDRRVFYGATADVNRHPSLPRPTLSLRFGFKKEEGAGGVEKRDEGGERGGMLYRYMEAEERAGRDGNPGENESEKAPKKEGILFEHIEGQEKAFWHHIPLVREGVQVEAMLGMTWEFLPEGATLGDLFDWLCKVADKKI